MRSGKKYIAITASGTVSPLGLHASGTGESWYDGKTRIKKHVRLENAHAAALPEGAELRLEELKGKKKAFSHLDRSVLLAILAAEQLKPHIELNKHLRIGVNIGSSRGATGLFEKDYGRFSSDKTMKTSAYTSPTTTLGNLSSWVMQHLELHGPVISHSITCSTAMQALINGIAWLKADMADMFIVGGTEAPLTPFTIAQMRSMNIYAPDTMQGFPCMPLAAGHPNQNSMVLGEGASLFLLEKISEEELETRKVLAIIKGFGYGNEAIHSLTNISSRGEHFQKSMKMALQGCSPPDLILLHAPGTAKGDASELHAINTVFSDNTHDLYSNKWQIGHTLGASAALSIQNAIDILAMGTCPSFPYPTHLAPKKNQIQSILVNAAGFGGNAGSVLLHSEKVFR